jgi:hypothetical protein
MHGTHTQWGDALAANRARLSCVSTVCQGLDVCSTCPVCAVTDSMLALAEDHLNDIMSNLTAAGTAALASYVSALTYHRRASYSFHIHIHRTAFICLWHVHGSTPHVVILHGLHGLRMRTCMYTCVNVHGCVCGVYRCPMVGGWILWEVSSFLSSFCGGGMISPKHRWVRAALSRPPSPSYTHTHTCVHTSCICASVLGACVPSHMTG